MNWRPGSAKRRCESAARDLMYLKLTSNRRLLFEAGIHRDGCGREGL